MYFLNRKESNFEYTYVNSLKRSFIYKSLMVNKHEFIKLPNIKLYFWFKKIKEEELNFIKLFNHLIFLWLITGQKAIVKKLNNTLNKGIRYYRVMYVLNLKKINYFKFLNFLIEILIPLISKNSKKIHLFNNKELLISINDLNMFTNYRISNNLYLNSIHDKLFIKINNNSKINLKKFITLLKLK